MLTIKAKPARPWACQRPLALHMHVSQPSHSLTHTFTVTRMRLHIHTLLAPGTRAHALADTHTHTHTRVHAHMRRAVGGGEGGGGRAGCALAAPGGAHKGNLHAWGDPHRDTLQHLHIRPRGVREPAPPIPSAVFAPFPVRAVISNNITHPYRFSPNRIGLKIY